MERTAGFVSGRSNNRFKPRVVIHDRPIPWDEYLKRFGDRPTTVSHADQARDEAEAQVKHKETEKKSSQKRRKGWRKCVPGPCHAEFNPSHIGAQTCTAYETDERLTRIHREVNRIRDEAKFARTVFDTVTKRKPTARQRRSLKRILNRLQHELDTLPRQ